MSYGYYANQSSAVPPTDPVVVDADAHAVTVTLPATRSASSWSRRFTLHALKRCTACRNAVVLYVAGAAPPELAAFPDLISRGWENGAWRLATHSHGFVLYAAKHPYTVDVSRVITGTCHETSVELVFAAALPAQAPLVPPQPARTPRSLKAVRPPLPEEAEPSPDASSSTPTPPSTAARQLALF